MSIDDPRAAQPVELERRGLFGSEIGIERNAQVGPNDLAVFEQLVDHPPDEVAGNAEANPLVAAASA